MGVTLAGTGTIWSTTQQRFREQQLIFIGNQYSMAISAYYKNSPDGILQFPKKLEDLLEDKRYLSNERYLRKLFADPMTGSKEWGLIKGADGGIVGVHSMSKLEPIKQSNFAIGNEALAGRKHYFEWQFTYKTTGYIPVVARVAPVKPKTNPSGAPAAPTTPPLPPPPPDATTDPHKQNMCKNMFGIDTNTCALLIKKFDQTVVDACNASANQRYAICMSTENAFLPSLDVQYK